MPYIGPRRRVGRPETAATIYRQVVPTHDRVEIVRFSGGELSGLVVEAPADLAWRLPDMKLTVTAAGQLYDLVAQCRLREVRVIARPGTPPPAAPLPVPAPAEAEVVEPEPEPVPIAVTVPTQAVPPRRPAPGAPLFMSARPAQ